MDGVGRLGGAVAAVERLLAQKTGVQPHPRPADQHRRDMALEYRTVAHMRATEDSLQEDRRMVQNILFECRTVGTASLPVEWDIMTINVQEKNSLLFHIKEGIKTIDLKALRGRSGVKEDVCKPACTIEEKCFNKTVDTTTSTADHTGNLFCPECQKAKGSDESVVALFQIEARKKLAALEKITEDTEEDLKSKEDQNRGMFVEFKNLIRQNTEGGSTVFEATPPGVKSGVSDSGALAKLVESPSFEKYLDRQIVATILRGEAFRKHLLSVLEAREIEEIVQTHVPCVTGCLAGLFQKDAPDDKSDYETLWSVLNERYCQSRDSGKDSGEDNDKDRDKDRDNTVGKFSNNTVDNFSDNIVDKFSDIASGTGNESRDITSDESRDITGDKSRDITGDKSRGVTGDKLRGVTSDSNTKELEEYRCIFEEIMKRVNKGNFECDNRFLRIIGRTINKIGVYDDPVLCKMTVQFVLCKRYVEDFVGIKKALKRFARCDI